MRLAEALAERAALAIENGRLYQAALQATQLRDEVLGVVAHDLRNPVAAITMAAAALRRRGPEGERRNLKPSESIHPCGRADEAADRDLLDVTLIEAGQLGVERARCPRASCSRECVEAQRPLAASASLDLRLELAEDLPDIWGDQHRLLQVLENLVGNAIKFTPAGAASPSAQRRGRARCCSGSPTRAAASRPTAFRTSSTASGRRRRAPTAGRDWVCPSRAGSSRRTAGASGSRARWAAGASSSSPFPGRPARRRPTLRDDALSVRAGAVALSAIAA